MSSRQNPALSAVEDGWNGVGQALGDLVSDLAKGPPDTLTLASDLENAKGEWAKLHTQILDFQRVGPQRVTKVQVA